MEDTDKTIIIIGNVAEFERRSKQFLKQLISHFRGKKKENILFQLFGEIEDNIKQHSQAKNAVLDFSTRSSELADVVISDDGIGIGGSFRQAGIEVDDREALKLALKGRSTKKEGSRGWGLPTTVALVQELKGSMEIESGEANITIEGNAVVDTLIPKRKGTSVTLVLPLNLEISDQTFYSIVAGEQ